MHTSVMNFVKKVLVVKNVIGQSILEVGSLNVNGSARPYLCSLQPASYTGLDMRPGRSVDYVCDACDLTKRYGVNRFDIVVSTEMLEHVEHWQTALENMHQVCKDNGIVLITTRSPGFKKHSYPHDYWRFTKEDFSLIYFYKSNIFFFTSSV